MSETFATKSPKEAGMLCPACQVALVMSERQNIEIDYCPSCRGVWLDRGELDKIIERSVAALSDSQPPFADGPMKNSYPLDQSHRHGGHRRKSWLKELFD